MNYRSDYLARFSILGLILLSLNAASAERVDLYDSGKDAYLDGDYVAALKNLHAFYVLNQDEIDRREGFKAEIINAVTYSEQALRRDPSTVIRASEDLECQQRQILIRASAEEVQDLLNSDWLKSNESEVQLEVQGESKENEG